MEQAEEAGRFGARRVAAALLALCLAAMPSMHAQLHRHGGGAPPPDEPAQAEAVHMSESTLPVLDPAQMHTSDRTRLQQREVDVSQAAAFYGFDISDSAWTYQQVVCRSLPDHLILSFRNDSAQHGASHFTAVIPANGDKVQVVTEFAHGLLPFHAAWEKSTAYLTFNHMVETDRGQHPLSGESHWLNLGMCFVALTGPVPHVGLSMTDVAASEALAKRNGSGPAILMLPDGAAQVHFSDVSDAQLTGNWLLRFDSKGRLTKATVDRVHPLNVTTSTISPLPAAITE